jgi:hypothetical protein
MKMIDQYVFEVGENLPEKLRADLEKEIHSLIEDTLEERSRTSGRAIDDAMIAEVLKEFDAPAKMAASYQPQRYLIGPRLYPTFILVIKIVSSVVLVLALIGLGVEAAQGGNSYSTIFELILHSVGTVFQSLLTVLGNIVFIFAIIERFVPQGIENQKEWDPRSMKKIEEPDKISRFEQGWIILWSSVAILLFNFYPQLLRFGFLQNGQWYFFTFLSEAFFKYVPALTILWGLEIILSIFQFRAGVWQTATRWFKVLIKVLNIVLLAVIIAGPPILDLTFEGLPEFANAFRGLNDVFPFAYTGFRTLLIVVLVIEGIELGGAIYRAITGKQFKLNKS